MTDSIAVLHGNYFQRGGGEVVADAIAEALDAPLYYGFGNESAMPDDDTERVKLFDPGRVSKAAVRRFHQYRDAYFMWNGQYLPELYDYDVIVQSGNEFGWYVPRDDQIVVKYVHSPPRGPYDQFHQHGDSPLHRAYSLAAKTLYRHTVTIPDVYLANSELVANRCQKYWGVNADILHPPVDVSGYGPEHAVADRDRTYLTFSRLYRHKRIREIVEAFDYLDGATLLVGGDGPQREHLESIASENVDIRGYLSESEKRTLLAEVDALVFNARNEDFGIVPIEAFASGTPVIGINDGFTRYQIADGQNGVLFPGGEATDIHNAVLRFERDGVDATPQQLQAFAETFSMQSFARGLQQAISQARDATHIENLAAPRDWGEHTAGVEDVDAAVPDGGEVQ